MMRIKPRFDNSKIQKIFEEKAALIHKATLNRLARLGEKCVIHAINNRGYTDQTGNLTSSFGYVLSYNGKVVTNGGFAVKDGATAGAVIGKKLAASKAQDYPQGYALVVVAGMEYAAYVEAKGRNVLTATEVFCEAEFPKMIKQLKKNIDAQFS